MSFSAWSSTCLSKSISMSCGSKASAIGIGRFRPTNCGPRSCGELLQERLGILQYRRVEPFGEPVVDGSEKITGFSALALIAPEPCQVECRTQLPELGALPPGYCERLAIALLRCAVLP